MKKKIKFKAGDLITHRFKGPCHYVYTIPGILLQVLTTGDFGEDDITVQILSGKNVGRQHQVNSKYFKLAKIKLA